MFRSLLYDHPQGSSFVLDEASKQRSGNALSTKDDP
jgi:hypothetical protein